MKTNLKLVHDSTKAISRSRTVLTNYFRGPRDKRDAYVRQGHSCTNMGAVNAAVMRIVHRDFHRADIYNAAGRLHYVIYTHGKDVVVRKIGR